MSPRRPTKTDDLPDALRALADPTRMKIMLMLEGKRRTVGEIAGFFALSQPTISRHLQGLAAAGLVRRAKSAQRVYYEINIDNLRNVCLSLTACFPCCCVTVTPQTGLEAPLSIRTTSKGSLPEKKKGGRT